MATAVFVLGLCGSGKTHVAQAKEALGFQNFGEGVVPSHDCAKWHDLLAELRAGKDCVVTEIAYFGAQHRDILRQHTDGIPGATVEWVCFENDQAVADENCRRDFLAGKRAKNQYEANLIQNGTTMAMFRTGEYTHPVGVPLTKIFAL